jgi:hypothetical protein
MRLLVHNPALLGEVTFALEWGDDPQHSVSLDQVQICGKIVGVSISLMVGNGRTTKFALVNWSTGQYLMACVNSPIPQRALANQI